MYDVVLFVAILRRSILKIYLINRAQLIEVHFFDLPGDIDYIGVLNLFQLFIETIVALVVILETRFVTLLGV